MLLRNLGLVLGTLLLYVLPVFSQDVQNERFNHDANRSFITNHGQFEGRTWNSNDSIHFAYAHNPFYIFFTESGVVYRLDKIVKNKKHKEDVHAPKRKNISELVRVEWLNANDDVEIVAESPVDFHYSYAMYNEDHSIRNINNIAGYQKVTYKNIYDHIDIEYAIHPDGGVKYNVIVHPGGNPSDLQARYHGTHTSGEGEFVQIALNDAQQLEINTSLGSILEHAPKTFSNGAAVDSKYRFENNVLHFDIGSYDTTKDLIIDPWIVSPTFNTSTAVWEVETDGAGNVYTIGGETPMELWKYNSAGVLQWQYVTPWDTSSVWLGTLATDAAGNSYVTSGVTAEMHKVDNAGNFVWQTALSGGLQYNSEWWSITFNCDETKLITGGTWVQGILTFDFYAGIFEIDVATGNVISDQTVDFTNIGGFGATPIEVRSISSSKNSKFIYLTHEDVGAINENFGSCPNVSPIYQVDNGHHLSYKCENYLPSTQNGGGLKALVANDNYIYTHSGDEIHRRDLATGALINTVSLPGGNNTVDFFGNTVVHCSGLDVDDCGNVYAGSTNQVVKFDENLTQLSTSATSFAVYDVSVNANGEVLACGAQQNNQATNRNGRIESIAMTACSQYSLVCCDANVCAEGPFCLNDPAVALTPFTPGGTWSGTGVDASGNFDPAVAGVGTHIITYSLVCGADSIAITVNPCNVIEVCEEVNGDLTASGGTGPYSWYQGTITPVSSPITNEQECIDCPGATPTYIAGFYISCSQSTCNYNDTTWSLYTTGTTTTAPGSYPILIIDGNGDSLVVQSAAGLVACTANPCGGVTINVSIDNQTNVSCNGGSDGTATVSATGGTGPYTYTWIPGNLSGPSQNGLSATTYAVQAEDMNGCTGTQNVIITEPPAIAPVASLNQNPTTCGASDGIIEVCGLTASTTYDDLSYFDGTNTVNLGSFTTNGSGCYQITGLIAGSYTSFTVTAGVCSGSDAGPVTLTEPNAPTPTASLNQNPTTCGASDGIIEVCGLTASTTYDDLSYFDGTNTVNLGSFTTNGSGCYQITGLPAGSYTNFTVTTGTCSGSDAGSVSLSAPNAPTITVDGTTDVSCFGESDGTATVSVSGGTAPYSYSWSPSGGTNPTASGLTAGTYTVTVTDDAGCTSTETVTINQPTEIIISGVVTDQNCGQFDGSITTSVSGGSAPYTYTWSANGEVTPNLTNIASGSYMVTVEDDNGCVSSESFTVNAVGSANVVATPDFTTISAGETVQLTATGASTYVWTPSGSLSCSDCANPIASPTETTVYIVTGTDDFGCTGNDTLTVYVTINCEDLFVPNIFSPNGTGPQENETLCVYGNCISELSFRVFNRWGQLVFETETPYNGTGNVNEICWDGMHKGKPVQNGTYVYSLYAVKFDGEVVELSGNITVVR